jgi:hypothetical protein
MRAVRTIVAVAAAVAGAAALHTGVGAYTSYARWATTPVTFYVNPVNLDVSQAAAVAALQAGMDVWNTQSGSSFRYQYGGTATDTATTFDNRNVVLFRNASNGSTIATTYSWWGSSNELLDSDIIFWDSRFTFFTGSSGCGGVSDAAYIEDIAAHEFGHALGLSHSTSTDATMYPSYSYCSTSNRTLATDDINGARALYPVTSSNTAPSVTISSPANGSAHASGATITFTGSASDTQDGLLTSALAWTSNIDGAIGLGGSFSRVLSAGTHTIKATAVDSGGLTTVRQVSVTVASSNTAPSVSISSPANGATFASGAVVSFSGSASDAQDGSLTAALAWTSNINGAIGTGGAFTKVLTAGTHTIKATVTDSGGMTTVRQVTVTVNAPSSGGTLTARGRRNKGSQVVDLTWSGMSGTSLDVYRNSTKWATPNDGAETDAPGKKGGGSYTYKVCAAGTTTCSNTATVTF